MIAISVGAYALAGFLLPLSGGIGASNAFVRTFALTPFRFWEGEVWQPLTALFLHGSLLHLVFNMLGLWSLGRAIEDTIGSLKYAGLCVVSGLTGSLFVILFQNDLVNPTLGASGILLGLLGAIAVFYPNSPLLIFFLPMKARTAAIVVGILSILLPAMGLLEGISHMSHLGGLIGGVIFSRLVLRLRFGGNDLHRQHPGNPRKVHDPYGPVYRPFDHSPRYPQEKVINPLPTEPEAPRKELRYDPLTGKHYFG